MMWIKVKHLLKYFASEFKMKELGEMKYFLGVEATRSKTWHLLISMK